MNTSNILRGVEKLHAQAANHVRNITYRYNGASYLFDFDGRNIVCRHADGTPIANFNTRKLSTAKAWLREWLAN